MKSRFFFVGNFHLEKMGDNNLNGKLMMFGYGAAGSVAMGYFMHGLPVTEPVLYVVPAVAVLVQPAAMFASIIVLGKENVKDFKTAIEIYTAQMLALMGVAGAAVAYGMGLPANEALMLGLGSSVGMGAGMYLQK